MKKIHKDFADMARNFGSLKHGRKLLALTQIVDPNKYCGIAMDKKGNFYHVEWNEMEYRNYLVCGYININFKSSPKQILPM